MLLERDHVDPFAQMLVESYLSAAGESRTFTATYGTPPTRMQKTHTMRSIAQAMITQSDRFVLHPEFAEMGRVQVTDVEMESSYLIRSKAAIDIEAAMGQPEQLVIPYPDDFQKRVSKGLPYLLAYGFQPGGMRLWSCTTKQAVNRKRLLPAGELEHVGFWPYEGSGPNGPDDGNSAFDQGAPDPFDDLGDDVDFGEAEGS